MHTVNGYTRSSLLLNINNYTISSYAERLHTFNTPSITLIVYSCNLLVRFYKSVPDNDLNACSNSLTLLVRIFTSFCSL